jgi:hypothetical protein
VAEDWNAMLERQVAHFSSDERLSERADEVRDASPAERWAAMRELCATLDWFLDRMDPVTRARATEPEPRSAEVIAILEAMQKTA